MYIKIVLVDINILNPTRKMYSYVLVNTTFATDVVDQLEMPTIQRRRLFKLYREGGGHDEVLDIYSIIVC